MSVHGSTDSKDILLLRTVQCAAWRNLFETLKDVLTDANLIFDAMGMRCLQVDNNHNVLVSVKLAHSSFEEYHCARRCVVGVNMGNMFRLIKGIGQSDTLTVKICHDEPNVLQMCIQNFDKNMSSTFELNLLDIEEVPLTVPDTEFDSVLTMPSADFQRICRDLSILSETVEVCSDNRTLTMQACGDFAKQKIVIGEKDNGLYFANSKPKCDRIYGTYSLKYLNHFSKANVLCSTVDMYLKQDYPLILSYTIASLGRLLFCLACKQA